MSPDILSALAAFAGNNWREIAFGLILTIFLRTYIPQFIAWILKKTTQTVINFFVGIKGVKDTQSEFKVKITKIEEDIGQILQKRKESCETFELFKTDLNCKLDSHVVENGKKFNKIDQAISSVKLHEQNNSDATLVELKRLNKNFDNFGHKL